VPEHARRALRVGLPVLLTLCGLLPAREARAHVVNVFAVVEGKTIRGEVYFRGGMPAQDAKVEAFDPQGNKLAEATTDAEGKFSLQARVRCDHRLLAQAGEGHAGEYTVEAAELPDDLPPPDGSTVAALPPPEPTAASPAASDSPAATPHDARLEQMIDRAVGKRVNPLCKQLNRLGNRLWLRDVLGGVGYIFGIMGLLAYYLARRSKGPGTK